MPVLRATCSSIATYIVIATYRGNSLENSRRGGGGGVIPLIWVTKVSHSALNDLSYYLQIRQYYR